MLQTSTHEHADVVDVVRSRSALAQPSATSLSTNASLNRSPERRRRSSGTANARSSSDADRGERSGPAPVPEDDDRQHRLGEEHEEQPRDPPRPERGVEHRDDLAAARDRRAGLLPDEREGHEDEEDHGCRGLAEADPARGARVGQLLGRPRVEGRVPRALEDDEDEGRPEHDVEGHRERQRDAAADERADVRRRQVLDEEPRHEGADHRDRHDDDKQHPYEAEPLGVDARPDEVQGATAVAGGQPHGVAELDEHRVLGVGAGRRAGLEAGVDHVLDRGVQLALDLGSLGLVEPAHGGGDVAVGEGGGHRVGPLGRGVVGSWAGVSRGRRSRRRGRASRSAGR